MKARRTVIALIAALAAAAAAPVTASAATNTINGTLPDGATYLIEVPSPWNGTLLLYSHGYVVPGAPNPAHDVGDPGTRAFLLANGFALAGSSYAHTGWALQEAVPDQMATLAAFNAQVGHPTRTIAWGHSLGGIITADLLQTHPDSFDAAMPMCGVVAGGVATWNQALDSEFAFQQLIAGPTLDVVNITNPGANLGLAEFDLAAAQKTPQGRARLALASAFGDLPGWFNPASPEPAATDFTTQEANQFLWLQQVDFPFLFALRAELEFRAGGNPSWNTGVNYVKQLDNSIDLAEVQGLYAAAGLDLNADLATLNAANRITANPSSVNYLIQNVVFNGNLDGKPVLSMHTTGDGLVVATDEQSYRSVVNKAGNGPLLRDVFVHRAGHCTFTPAETVAALQALISRLDTGRWSGVTDPDTLNAVAGGLGPLNVATSAFISFEPARFLRPFTD